MNGQVSVNLYLADSSSSDNPNVLGSVHLAFVTKRC